MTTESFGPMARFYNFLDEIVQPAFEEARRKEQEAEAYLRNFFARGDDSFNFRSADEIAAEMAEADKREIILPET